MKFRFQKGNTFGKKCKGRIPWNKGQKGVFHHTTESKQKMSQVQKGKKLSPETIEKIRQANTGRKGLSPSPETRAKISKTLTGKKRPDVILRNITYMRGHIPWNKGKKGVQTPYWKGKKHSEETRKKWSEQRKGRKATDETKKKMRESLIARLRRGPFPSPNGIERLMIHALQNKGIGFVFQFAYKLGIADFFILPNIIVECDGEYWHNVPGAKERDIRQTEWLKQNGYQVFRFWEHEIKKDVQACVDKIMLATH